MREDVIKYEAILNESEDILQIVSDALTLLAQHQDKLDSLVSYYGSQAYFDDMALADSGQDYGDIPCRVLTEDAVYDVIGSAHELAIQMLELATHRIKYR